MLGGARYGSAFAAIRGHGNDRRTTRLVIEYASLVLHVPAADYGTTQFDMSDDHGEALVDAGRSAMAAYLEDQADGRASRGGWSDGGPHRKEPSELELGATGWRTLD